MFRRKTNAQLTKEWYDYFNRVEDRQRNDMYGIGLVKPVTIDLAKMVTLALNEDLYSIVGRVSIDDEGCVCFSLSHAYGTAVIKVHPDRIEFIKEYKSHHIYYVQDGALYKVIKKYYKDYL